MTSSNEIKIANYKQHFPIGFRMVWKWLSLHRVNLSVLSLDSITLASVFVSAEREFDAVTPRRRVEETIRVLIALVVSKVLMAKTARRKSEGQQVGVREGRVVFCLAVRDQGPPSAKPTTTIHRWNKPNSPSFEKATPHPQNPNLYLCLLSEFFHS